MLLKCNQLNKWGYRGQKFICDQLNVWYRPNTTDEKVIKEVLLSHAYQKKSIGFIIEPTDVCLDLGGNIGTFSLLALSIGCQSVICLEPESENFGILTRNIVENFGKKKNRCQLIKAGISTHSGTGSLYLCQGDYNKYRHTMVPKKNRTAVEIKLIGIRELLADFPEINFIKMDIEGIEINLLEFMTESDFKNITKLVFEYSFDVDNSIPRFMKIIHKLQKIFETVYFTKVKENEEVYKFFPPCTNVYCLK